MPSDLYLAAHFDHNENMHKKDTTTPNNQYEILLIGKFVVSFYCN